MADRFSVCLPFILKEEGGNDDDPHDPGGRTSRGIIQREYDGYRCSKCEPTQDVWCASDDEVSDIYQQQYWLPYCPQMAPGIDLVFFDIAVNSGPVEAAKLLQRGLGVQTDGHIGIVTKAALSSADPVHLIAAVCDAHRAFYRSLRTFRYFGKGWLKRVSDIELAATSMTVGDLHAKP